MHSVVSVINKEDPDAPRISEHFTFDENDLFTYYETFCYPNVPEGTAYTYGSRFRGGYDQFLEIVDLLRKNKTLETLLCKHLDTGRHGVESPSVCDFRFSR
ncbi:DUF4346 domain-containing protein [Biomphalaria pfeifferi]|uniref:DUF4346 domain-containing protein n=1 Tax=Biomphalaria pfeifferi TaxID=112525 RepID=A0AAD8ETX6_BIOPF|nr:DUF4346 domain-containing protein [Biomphalaria pfeifferi]